MNALRLPYCDKCRLACDDDGFGRKCTDCRTVDAQAKALVARQFERQLRAEYLGTIGRSWTAPEIAAKYPHGDAPDV